MAEPLAGLQVIGAAGHVASARDDAGKQHVQLDAGAAQAGDAADTQQTTCIHLMHDDLGNFSERRPIVR